jgi:hypothetical protein
MRLFSGSRRNTPICTEGSGAKIQEMKMTYGQALTTRVVVYG